MAQDNKSYRNKKGIEVNKILLRSFFAHHPNCDQYDHHVLEVGKWRFCLGCTAMYLFIGISLILDLLFLRQILQIGPISRYLLGFIFFIPAIIQLYWKSKIKIIKFSMRGSLGISIWFLISAIFATPFLLLQIIAILIFIMGVWIYSRIQASKQLIECKTCIYDQEYDTCLIKYEDIISIDDVEILADDSPIIDKIVTLQKEADKETNKEGFN